MPVVPAILMTAPLTSDSVVPVRVMEVAPDTADAEVIDVPVLPRGPMATESPEVGTAVAAKPVVKFHHWDAAPEVFALAALGLNPISAMVHRLIV
jgi:hypothetical protein